MPSSAPPDDRALRDKVREHATSHAFREFVLADTRGVVYGATADQLVALVRAVAGGEWSETPPNVPGWYWVRTMPDPNGERGVWIVEVDKSLHVEEVHVTDWSEIDWWCGPIPAPAEKEA